MRRYEESSKKQYEHAVRLGQDNVECIREMQQWCKHFEISRTSGGMYAEMSGLPIASHKIGCKYAHGSEAMILRWICSEFLVQQCSGCPHHLENGNTDWGRGIIARHQEAILNREQKAKERDVEIARMRESFRRQSKIIGNEADPRSQRIIGFLESIFSQDQTELAASAKYLVESAQLAADLFPNPAIDVILALVLNDDFSNLFLPVCRELASRRHDLNTRLKDVALECIEKKRDVELAAAVICRLVETRDVYPLASHHIENLLLTQNHVLPIGGWGDAPPDYSHCTSALVRSFDADPESFFSVVRQYLASDDDQIRVQLCGGLILVQEERPQCVMNILEDLLKSLQRYEYDEMGTSTPSGKLVHILQAAFRHSPEVVDVFLAEAMLQVRPTVQEDIIRVYRDQFFDRSTPWRERRIRRGAHPITLTEKVSIQRLLSWIKDEQLEPDIRAAACESLHIACTYATDAMFDEFNSLLGYYAIVCEQEQPPAAAPKIVLPGHNDDPMLEQLKRLNRSQDWQHLKSHLQKCLEELCEARPVDTFDSINSCLNQTNSHLGDEFKGSLVALLGQVGKQYELRPRVLPIMMRAMMDYGSAFVRAKAISATVDMFSHSSASPPANMVDTIIVHLRDTKVIVHQAALRAVSWRPSWFQEHQRIEVIQCLAAHLKAYENDHYQIDDICDAILGVGRNDDQLKLTSLQLVESVFPTNEELVDAKIIEELMRFAEPSDRIAGLVALDVAAFLGLHGRDRYNSYSDSRRADMFEWLHELPASTFHIIVEEVFASAKTLCARDAWEGCHFASLFSQFGAFQYERDLLRTAAGSLSHEPRFDNFRRALERLALIAAANSLLQANDPRGAAKLFAVAGEH